MKQEKKVILLAGPTASGKSKLSIKLAKDISGEIINADSMQIYKEISILTSRPNEQDEKIIKHHLYGFNSVKKKFSTGLWLKMVSKKIEELWSINKTPIVVGGSGLYFKALTDGLVKIPDIPNDLKSEVRSLHKKLGQKIFFQKLIEIDPMVKNLILPSDVQRSMRSYEVKKFTNKSLFELIKETKPNFEKRVFKKIFINTPKEELHKKIEKRVIQMFNDGVIEEVKNFFKMKVYKELSANKIIGINEIKLHIKGKLTLDTTKNLVALKTRQYAKRQFTWSRGHMKSWEMIYSSNIKDLFEKAINKIS
ncbi:MAG: tRNA (adenosine(37)-N6)-dimethylallyltransferase MiaA [Candidatus Pelagibacterales bacterium]|nr:MAG: tRNA (adenosine(37)-N6)-dimethylallyltransferase MiaA [Pelagibacterales bacterium]